LKTWILWKTAKLYELCETLGLRWIGLWNVCVYATAFICDLCIYFVEAFELVLIWLLYNLENDKTIRTLEIWVFVGFWPMKRKCTHYCTYMWFVCILGWGVWIHLLWFWRIYRKMLVFINLAELCQTNVLWSDNSW